MASELYDVLTGETCLRMAWRRVRRNKGAPGGDGMTVVGFGRDIAHNLTSLRRSLLEGRYRPGPLSRVRLAKPAGGFRVITIPCVRDRIAQAAVALTLDPVLDPLMSDASFAYRRGRSVQHAIGRVLTYRLWGFEWAADGDVEAYFDSIPHRALSQDVRARVTCLRTRGLISLWLAGFSVSGRGLAQGSPLSPILANLYLTPFDRAFDGRRERLVRYGDDLMVFTRSRTGAQRACERTAVLLRDRGLVLNSRKTRVTSFAEGFEFLGYRFSGSGLPIPIDDGESSENNPTPVD